MLRTKHGGNAVSEFFSLAYRKIIKLQILATPLLSFSVGGGFRNPATPPGARVLSSLVSTAPASISCGSILPGHRHLAMRKSLGAHRPPQEAPLQNTDPSSVCDRRFCIRAKRGSFIRSFRRPDFSDKGCQISPPPPIRCCWPCWQIHGRLPRPHFLFQAHHHRSRLSTKERHRPALSPATSGNPK